MPREGGSEEPALLTNEFVPPKSSEGHRRNRRTRGGFPRAVTLRGDPALSALCTGSEDPPGPTEGRKRLEKELTAERRVHFCLPEPGSMSGTGSLPFARPRRRAGRGGSWGPHAAPLGTPHGAGVPPYPRAPTSPSPVPSPFALPPRKDQQQNNRRKSGDIY